MYKIGRVSEILGISVQTIRYYEKYGLIEPDFICSESGYRYFSDESLYALWRINILKSAGFSLKEIKNLSSMNIDSTKEELIRKKTELKKIIEMQEYALNYIDRNINAIEKMQNSNKSSYEYRLIPDRKGIKIDLPDSSSQDHRFSTLSKIQALYGMNQEVLFQPSRKINIVNDKIKLDFLLALYTDDSHSFENEIVQPGGIYYIQNITVRNNREKTIEKILNQIESDGYIPRGDGIQLLIFDETLSNNRDTFLVEFQIAVIKKENI